MTRGFSMSTECEPSGRLGVSVFQPDVRSDSGSAGDGLSGSRGR